MIFVSTLFHNKPRSMNINVLILKDYVLGHEGSNFNLMNM